MKVNIYYGGRGLIDDPAIYVMDKVSKVLDELNVKVQRYNLYEDKRGISMLPKTLKEADAIVLARRNEEDRYTVRQIAVMAALSLYGGLTSQGVDNAAHFGGFIAGFILAWILTMLQKRRGVS